MVELDVVMGNGEAMAEEVASALRRLIVVKRMMKYDEVTRRGAGCCRLLYPRRGSGDVGRWSWRCGFLGASFYMAS